MIKLHNYWRSSASHRVRIALGLKGLAFEYVAVNIVKDEQHAEGYTKHNAMAQVPTLEIVDEGNDVILTQSLPIIEYLEDVYPDPPILPNEPTLRAKCRALAEIVNSGIQPLQNLSVTKAIAKLGADAGAWPKAFIANGLAAYERLAATTAKKFSCGDGPTLADCCLVPQLASARRFGVDLAPFPRLTAIEEACLALPAFAAAAPDRQPDAVKV